MICVTKPWIITTDTLRFVCLSRPEYDSDEDLVVPCCWSLQEDFDNAAAADRHSYCLLTICLDSHHCCIEMHCTLRRWHQWRHIWPCCWFEQEQSESGPCVWLEFKNFGIKCGDTFAPFTVDSCLLKRTFLMKSRMQCSFDNILSIWMPWTVKWVYMPNGFDIFDSNERCSYETYWEWFHRGNQP